MKLAIIGASLGQKELCIKAKEMGISTIAFAWENGAICKDLVDRFYPISITEVGQISSICKEEKVDGFVSNASEWTIDTVGELCDIFGTHGAGLQVIQNIKNKFYVRNATKNVTCLQPIKYRFYDGSPQSFFPCVVKPCTGGGKKGVSFCNNENDFLDAINYVKPVERNGILIEEYISGKEVSVETISYENKHYVVQITDKDNTGAPHFVEIGHHQPAELSKNVIEKINIAIPHLLKAVNYTDGAAHIELKIDEHDNIYLIEINCRGGGDEISNKLVYLSSGYDYVKGMIEVALGIFKEPVITNKLYSGIYYLCKQTERLLPYFNNNENYPWLVERTFNQKELELSVGNRSRNGFIIYQSDKKIIL